MCEASAKFVKRSTAKMAVSPIAGTARIVPAIRPLRMSCRTSMSHAGSVFSGERVRARGGTTGVESEVPLTPTLSP